MAPRQVWGVGLGVQDVVHKSGEKVEGGLFVLPVEGVGGEE